MRRILVFLILIIWILATVLLPITLIGLLVVMDEDWLDLGKYLTKGIVEK